MFAFSALKIRTSLDDLTGAKGLKITQLIETNFDVLRLKQVGSLINDVVSTNEMPSL